MASLISCLESRGTNLKFNETKEIPERFAQWVGRATLHTAEVDLCVLWRGTRPWQLRNTLFGNIYQVNHFSLWALFNYEFEYEFVFACFVCCYLLMKEYLISDRTSISFMVSVEVAVFRNLTVDLKWSSTVFCYNKFSVWRYFSTPQSPYIISSLKYTFTSNETVIILLVAHKS